MALKNVKAIRGSIVLLRSVSLLSKYEIIINIKHSKNMVAIEPLKLTTVSNSAKRLHKKGAAHTPMQMPWFWIQERSSKIDKCLVKVKLQQR